MDSPLTELEKRGLAECDKCKSLMNGFGYNSYNFDLFCYTYGIFNKHLNICLKCGNEMFSWMNKNQISNNEKQ